MGKTMHSGERYTDPTAAQAIENIDKENKKNKKCVQGNRSRSIGKSFETIIHIACLNYENAGVAIIEKTPEPIKILGKVTNGRFSACFEKKAQPDFKGSLIGGGAVIFEAKATEKDRIKKDVITLQQFEYLEGHWQLGTTVFVLLSFGLERYYRISWGIWREMEVFYNRKYLLETDILDCKVPLKNGYLNFLENIAEVKI